MYNGSLVLLSWSPFDGVLWDILQPFPATVGRNDIIISNLLSCSISWDASCRNSFYMAQSTWLLLVSTNLHGPASLSRRPLLWISFRKKHVFEGISWSFFFSKQEWLSLIVLSDQKNAHLVEVCLSVPFLSMGVGFGVTQMNALPSCPPNCISGKLRKLSEFSAPFVKWR